MLYIVATPIGNRSDITERAREVLGSVDCVVAEDTRHTGELLAFFGIKKPLISFRDAPQPVMDKACGQVLARLSEGESVAYVTDAGTPGVSDPGWRLVDAALEAGVTVVPIPGPAAVTALISVANKPLDEYRFMGFLPKKKGFQTTVTDLLAYLGAGDSRGVIFYESPNRVQSTLRAFLERNQPVYAVIGRELTKKFESVYRGELSEDFIKSLPDRGEYVILLTT